MAQINITLSEEEVKQVLIGERNEVLKYLLKKILNETMKAECEEQLGAARHERSESRIDYRNGSRQRPLTTRIGTLNLEEPRHRNEPFHTMVFENYRRSEASLIATMVQMVIAGVSTTKMSKAVETLCGKEFSKSTVSELCKSLAADINAFKINRWMVWTHRFSWLMQHFSRPGRITESFQSLSWSHWRSKAMETGGSWVLE